MMRKLYKKPLQMLVVVFVVLFALSSFVVASSVSDLKDQQDEINSQLEEDQSALDENQDAQDDTQAQLDEINANLDAVQTEINQISGQLEETQANLDQQQSEYDDIQAKLADSQGELRERVSAIYKNGNVSYLDVLFSSEDIQDFISGCAFLGKIVDQDQSIINSINENKALAEEKLDELETTRNQIAALQKQKESEEADYSAQAEAKQTLLAQLGDQEDDLESEIADEQSQMADIESQINAYYAAKSTTSSSSSSSSSTSSSSSSSSSSSAGGSATTANNSGTFAWPLSISGTLTSGFGNRSNPLGSGSEYHPGIDIAAPKGTPVLAAEAGTVIISKMNSTGGYGNYIVIDHGGNVCTLYGHMSALYVSQGATVSRGQQIGAVGSTGRSTGNHLHFGVLVNGSPVNPLNYVSKP